VSRFHLNQTAEKRDNKKSQWDRVAMPNSYHDPLVEEKPSTHKNFSLDQKHLVVCSLAAVPDIVTSTKATALVSVLDTLLMPATPSSIGSDRHFKLAIDDIEAQHDGLKHAELKHIDALCKFAREWHSDTDTQRAQSSAQSRCLVVHCYAGVSRSTAAAFVMLCALNPNLKELTIAKYMRSQSATAEPNRLIVHLGDEVLGRKGRMSKAIRAISGDYSCEAARPFALKTELEDAPKGSFWGSEAA